MHLIKTLKKQLGYEGHINAAIKQEALSINTSSICSLEL